MEMTVGTMVTIVLLVAVLVMVLFFINQIRVSGTNAIDSIDSATRAEINKIFAQDDEKSMVIYPTNREITIKKGEQKLLGFGFLLRNKGEADTFKYNVLAKSTDCSLTLPEADALIAVGKQDTVVIGAATIMEEPIYVKFRIPETAPECLIRYAINVDKGNSVYTSNAVDLVIKSK